jgi:hypothetical protein
VQLQRHEPGVRTRIVDVGEALGRLWGVACAWRLEVALGALKKPWLGLSTKARPRAHKSPRLPYLAGILYLSVFNQQGDESVH